MRLTQARERTPAASNSAFLVGKVLDVVPTPDRDGRFLVEFSEYALIDMPEVWKGDRNPVRYAKVEDLDIPFDTLDWRPMPARPTRAPEALAQPLHPAPAVSAGDRPLTMAEAKKGLALTFGVPAEAIEITIRG